MAIFKWKKKKKNPKILWLRPTGRHKHESSLIRTAHNRLIYYVNRISLMGRNAWGRAVSVESIRNAFVVQAVPADRSALPLNENEHLRWNLPSSLFQRKSEKRKKNKSFIFRCFISNRCGASERLPTFGRHRIGVSGVGFVCDAVLNGTFSICFLWPIPKPPPLCRTNGRRCDSHPNIRIRLECGIWKSERCAPARVLHALCVVLTWNAIHIPFSRYCDLWN